MLLSKTVLMKWNVKNKQRYIELGYTFTKIKDEFKLNVCDLPEYSKTPVLVRCDYCGKEITKQWINYKSEKKKNPDLKDACRECSKKYSFFRRN